MTARTSGYRFDVNSDSVTLFQNRYRIESARLPQWDYSDRGWYLVTMCTQDKQCTLACAYDKGIRLSPAGTIAETHLRSIPSYYTGVSIDRFVVMPNHIHAIVVMDGKHLDSPEMVERSFPRTQAVPARRAASLSSILGSYKAGVSRACRGRGILDFQWQARFHDHVLRSNASVNAARDYIERNPANWFEDPDNASFIFSAEDAASPVSTK